MAVVGQMQEFKPETEKFSTYVERVMLYFKANKVANDSEVAVFLTVVGPKCYSILSNCYWPVEKPGEQPYQKLEQKLKEHFDPPPVLTAERYHFYNRDQQPGGSLMTYIADLRRLAVICKFGDSLNDALRERFVCGLRNEATQITYQSDLDYSY